MCLSLNIQGMNPSATSRSQWKLPNIREMIQEKTSKDQVVPFVAICETWLKPDITDAEISITNYDVFRADRTKSQHGGVAIYAHQYLAIDDFVSYDDT